jgi:uroporphyrinogen-III synthase
MQKNKSKILSTALLPEAVLRESADQDIIIEIVPFVQIKTSIDAELETRIRELFQTPITAVFTSSNAVTTVAELFQKPIPWTVYSIGGTTAKTISQLFQIPITGTANDAAALANVIINDNVQEVYFFCGSIRRDVLPGILYDANILVHELVVYQTIETPQSVPDDYDAILFYSPSAVHSFFSVNRLNAATALFAIGNTTAAAIRQHTPAKIISAQQPDKHALVQQLIEYFNIKNGTPDEPIKE